MKKTFKGNSSLAAVLLLCGLSLTATAQTCTNTAIYQSTPTSDFTFHSDGTVAHNTTGLIWKRCLEGQSFSNNGTPDNYLDDRCSGSMTNYTWKAALEQVQTINSSGGFANQNDWHLPNQKGLDSIIENCRKNPAINTEVFPGGTSYAGWKGWSSSPGVNYPATQSYTWVMGFYDGSGYFNDRNGNASVWLVRSDN